MRPKFIYFAVPGTQRWYWELIASNGRVIGNSGGPYQSEAGAVASIAAVQRCVAAKTLTVVKLECPDGSLDKNKPKKRNTDKPKPVRKAPKKPKAKAVKKKPRAGPKMPARQRGPAIITVYDRFGSRPIT